MALNEKFWSDLQAAYKAQLAEKSDFGRKAEAFHRLVRFFMEEAKIREWNEAIDLLDSMRPDWRGEIVKANPYPRLAA